MRKRIDIKALLANPKTRRELMINSIIATQAREGITTTREQAETAYDKVMKDAANRERETIPRMAGATKKRKS